VLPDHNYGNSWEIVVDTADPLLAGPDRQGSVKPGDTMDPAAQRLPRLGSAHRWPVGRRRSPRLRAATLAFPGREEG